MARMKTPKSRGVWAEKSWSQFTDEETDVMPYYSSNYAHGTLKARIVFPGPEIKIVLQKYETTLFKYESTLFKLIHLRKVP